ncbi:MAG: DUF192 domain-containing protein [Candidatus Altiarchaeota archaeon]
MNADPGRLAAAAIVIFLVLLLLVRFFAPAQPDGDVCWGNEECLHVRVLDTPRAREKGLMGVESLPEDEGILLVFEKPGIRGEWMKGMRMNTDFIWLDDGGRIIQILEDLSPCGNDECPIYSSTSPSLYGIEANSGYARRHNLTAGSSADIYSTTDVCFRKNCLLGVCLDSRCVRAQVADEPAMWSKGLMFRRSIAAGGGMLFVFPNSAKRSFWMKNTVVPLEMIWLDSNLTVVALSHAVPCTKDPCPGYGPGFETAYVLEVAGGFSESNGIGLGDKAILSDPI